MYQWNLATKIAHLSIAGLVYDHIIDKYKNILLRNCHQSDSLSIDFSVQFNIEKKMPSHHFQRVGVGADVL